MKDRKRPWITIVLLISFLLSALVFSGCAPSKDDENTLKIGTQNFTEVIIMAYAAQALIEDQSNFKVEIVPRLGSIVVLDQAMLSKEIDIGSLLFTGGATGILHPKFADEVDLRDPQWRDPDHIWEFLLERAPQDQGRVWLPALGWNNTYAVTVTREFAQEHGLKKVSDLQGLTQDLTIGMDSSYIAREVDGYEPLLALYEFAPFKRTVTMEISLLYRAIHEKQVDVGIAYSSDARVHAYDLVWLEDDRNLYPPYDAAFGINVDVIERAPEVAEILGQLSGKIDIEAIRRLNYEVDINQRDEKEVALEFLREIGLLSQ